MTQDRITQLRVAGLRSLADVTLDLSPLTVLIGENGAGKSSILEALELMRLAAETVPYNHQVLEMRHGGARNLFRSGASLAQIGLSVAMDGAELRYGFSFRNVQGAAHIDDERVDWIVPGEAPQPLLLRRDQQLFWFEPTPDGRRQAASNAGNSISVQWGSLGLPFVALNSTTQLRRLLSVLRGIDVHVPFRLRPTWQEVDLKGEAGPRRPSVIEPTQRLSRFGTNLAAVYQQLQNRGPEGWMQIINKVRLGLGDDVSNIRLDPTAPGPFLLKVVFGNLLNTPVSVEGLSDGQLAYLLFIGMCELHDGRSLLAVDEPDLHLHPGLLARVAWMLEEASETTPVIVATHSDRFLDALEKPGESVVLCQLDEHRATVLRRPNKDALAEWMETYRGIGSIRAQGLEAHVFDSDPAEGEK